MLTLANITEVTSDRKVSSDEISNLYKLRISEGDDALGIQGNRIDVTSFFNQSWSDNVVTANATKFSYNSKLNKSSITSTSSVT